MTSRTKTPPPPIQTADSTDIKVGMTLYGVDKNCHYMNLPKIEPLKVIQLDLGVRREVRLKTKNGTEWTWSASKMGPGASGEQLLYALFTKARSVAVGVAQNNVDNYESRIKSEKLNLIRAQKGLKEAKNRFADFKKKIVSLKSSNAPK